MTTEETATLTLADLRKTCKRATSGPTALGALLTEYHTNGSEGAHTTAIDMMVSILEFYLESRPAMALELHMRQENQKNGFVFLGGSSLTPDHMVVSCIALFSDTAPGDSRSVRLDLRLKEALPTWELPNRAASGYQVFVGTDSLIFGGRPLWDRDRDLA